MSRGVAQSMEAVVIKRILLGLCILSMTTFGLEQEALAQSGPCTAWIVGGSSNLFGGGSNGNNLINGVYNCIAGVGWWVSCLIQTASCPPPQICIDCLRRGNTGGAPINLATGNTFIEQKDIQIPGLGGGLSLVRTWNSAWPASQIASSIGIFGPNWRSTYEESVFVGSDHYVRYSRGDGTYWAFGYESGGFVPVAPANIKAILTGGTAYTTLAFQNGEQRHFDNTSGLLIAIVDPNGNTTQLSYDSQNRLTTVTDPVSRHLYFSYGNSSYTMLATSVTTDVGITYSYSYDTQGRLIQATKPDSTTLNYAYDSQSRITSVTDSNGKILESHTYDSESRGLTSSRAGGVDAITLTYSNP